MTQDPGSPENQGGQQQPGGWQDQPTEYNAGWQSPPPAGASPYGGPPGPPPGGYDGPPPGYDGPPPGYGGPPPGYGGPGGMGGPSGQMPANKNFFAALFDFGFNYFATPAVVKVLYIIGMVLIGLGWLYFLVVGFLQSPLVGIVALIGGGIAALFYLILFRVTLEFYYAVVRMSEDIHHRR